MAEEDEFGLDDELDELQSELDDEVGAGAATAGSRRFAIIGGVVLVVLVVGGVLFGMKLFKDDPEPRRGGPISADRQVMQEEKKAKKKKKIKYVRLYSQLSGEQVARVLKELSFAEISFTTEQNGNNFTVLVDEDEMDEARNLLAVKGLPAGAVKGYELLDESQTLGVTEFDKRIRFLRALSGELEKAIMQFEAIDDAKVQIVLPEQRLFSVTQPPVTSSILIRRVYGVEITDDVVFSIIMLVAKGVENLQPENVSVIDTQGIVLSEGIFERMAQRKAGTYEQKPKEPDPVKTATSRDDAVGQPVIPNFDRIREWFDLKWEFEQNLVKRSTKHLMGVLPLGAYKVSVTSELGPLEDGEIVDVRRLTIGVVVDNNNEDIYLDSETKQQIYSTVAGATGYVRGRDQIVLSRADFTLLTPEEKRELERLQKSEARRQLIRKAVTYGVPSVVGVSGLVGGFVYVRRRRRQRLSEDVVPSSELLQDAQDSGSEVDVESYVNRVRSVVDTEPELLAKLMEEWLGAPATSAPAAPAVAQPAPVAEPAPQEAVASAPAETVVPPLDDADDFTLSDDILDDGVAEASTIPTPQPFAAPQNNPASAAAPAAGGVGDFADDDFDDLNFDDDFVDDLAEDALS